MIRLGHFNVVIDACVLYDSFMRDILLQIADEVKRNLSLKIGEDKTNNVLRAINEAFPEAMDMNDTENIDFRNTNISPKDMHVLSTAICSDSQVILTYNINDFPKEDLNRFSIEPQTPDEFLINILNLSFKQILAIFENLESNYNNPPKSRDELLKWLEIRAPKFTSMITPYLDGSITRIY